MNIPTTSSNWLIDSKLLVGRYPHNQCDLDLLIGCGIVVFIDLTDHKQEKLKKYVLPSHIRYINFPIIDQKIAEDGLTLGFIKELYQIYQSLQTKELMYIHCKGGLGRTGVIAGLLLSKILNTRDYSLIHKIMNDNLKSREFKMSDKRKMKYYKCPQTTVQIKQLKRLL